MIGQYWEKTSRNDPAGFLLYKNHYTYPPNRLVAYTTNWMPPGYCLCLISKDKKANFGWQYTAIPRYDNLEGAMCTIFHSETKNALASEMIKEAIEWAYDKWGIIDLHTYVKPNAIRSINPGYCFKVAGFRFIRKTPKGLHLLSKYAPSN